MPMAIQAFTGESADLERHRRCEVADGADSRASGAERNRRRLQGVPVPRLRGGRPDRRRHDRLLPGRHAVRHSEFPERAADPAISISTASRCCAVRGDTLYGQGSMGGAIIYHTKNPSLSQFTFDGEAGSSKTAEAGDMNYRVAGAVSVPLISEAARRARERRLRLSRRLRGYVPGRPVGTPYKTDANDIRSSGCPGRGAVEPTDRLTLSHACVAVPDQSGLLCR